MHFKTESGWFGEKSLSVKHVYSSWPVHVISYDSIHAILHKIKLQACFSTLQARRESPLG